MPWIQKVLFFLTATKEKKNSKCMTLVPTILQTCMHKNGIWNSAMDLQLRKTFSKWKQTSNYEPLPQTIAESILGADSSIWAKCTSVLNKSGHSILTVLYQDVFLLMFTFGEIYFLKWLMHVSELKCLNHLWMSACISFSPVHSCWYKGKHAEISKRDTGDRE